MRNKEQTVERASQTWSGNWPQRLQRALRDAGFESASEFLRQFPGESYLTVVNRIAPWVAAAQLINMQMQEARASGTLRQAAMDGCARNLNDRLPDGWMEGGEVESLLASALAGVSASITVDAESPESARRLEGVYKAIKSLSPPVGWHPSGPNDPIICNAFAQGWPETDRNESMKN
jgi:hypothetical protein